MIKNLKKKKGFTLIELIIVIAILGILAAIAIPKFGNVQKDAKIKSDVSSAKTIANTTQMLLTQEDVALPADSNAATTQYKLIAVSTGDTDGAKIINALQSTPAPQYDKTNNTAFYVVVDENGGVKIYSGKSVTAVTDGTGALNGTSTQRYPE